MEVAFASTKHEAHSYFRHTCTCAFRSLNNLYLPAKYFSLIWVFVLQAREGETFWWEM